MLFMCLAPRAVQVVAPHFPDFFYADPTFHFEPDPDPNLTMFMLKHPTRFGSIYL